MNSYDLENAIKRPDKSEKAWRSILEFALPLLRDRIYFQVKSNKIILNLTQIKDYVDNNKTKKGWFLYACRIPENGKARVNGSHIARASQGYDQVAGDITVDLSMNDEGMEQWSRMTSENVNRLVAITMDNVVYSAPQVRGAINGGNTQISGSFSFDEANYCCKILSVLAL